MMERLTATDMRRFVGESHSNAQAQDRESKARSSKLKAQKKAPMLQSAKVAPGQFDHDVGRWAEDFDPVWTLGFLLNSELRDLSLQRPCAVH
jgi:hypothetical protein